MLYPMCWIQKNMAYIMILAKRNSLILLVKVRTVQAKGKHRQRKDLSTFRRQLHLKLKIDGYIQKSVTCKKHCVKMGGKKELPQIISAIDACETIKAAASAKNLDVLGNKGC